MTPHDALSDMKNVLDLLSSDELTINVNSVSIHTKGHQRIVTYESGLDLEFAIHKDFTQLTEYRRYIEDSMYLTMLNDGSLIQASYTFYRDKFLKHRLGFYPCPVDVSREDLLIDEPLSVIDGILLGGPASMFLRSPLRFDCSLKDASMGHPAVHLTMNWAHCRLASSAPLSFGHFIRIVFRNFYPRIWNSTQWLQELGVRRLSRCIGKEETTEPHIELGLGKDDSLLEEKAKRTK